MHFCEICNYLTTSNYNLKKHYTTQKHINTMNSLGLQKNLFYCINCSKEYNYKSSFIRHKNVCTSYTHDIINEISNNINKHNNMNNLNNLNNININEVNDKFVYEFELERLKKEHEYQLEIERLKNELNKKDLESKLEIKEIENKHLQLQVHDSNSLNISNITNTSNKSTHNFVSNTVINNNLKISKIQFLNLNFGNVIDINTFIENYKDKYGLNNQQTLTLLENYQSDGVNSCITTLVHYLKKSAIQQYKEIKGKEIPMEDIILPFVLSDKSLREHFEKSINGNWDKTTMVENIKQIVNITNNQVYNHHNKFLDFTASQRKRIINGILKASGFSLLTQISIPDFYKIDNIENEEENEENNIEKNQDCIENINKPEDEDEEEEDDEDY